MSQDFATQGQAFIKSVLSGDSVILRLKPIGGYPPECIFTISGIVAPRFSSKDKSDNFGFESREFLRLFIGCSVLYKIEYSNQRAFGTLTLLKPFHGETVLARILVKNGWAKLNQKTISEENLSLLPLEAQASAAKIGIWSELVPVNEFIDKVDDPKRFFEQHKNAQIPAIIEQVRDGSTFRVLLKLPRCFQYITLFLSGIKAPTFRKDVPNLADQVDPFSEEAKYFVETRLLQKNIHVILESVAQNGFYGSIKFSAGNIAEALLTEGLAQVLDWNLGICTMGENYKKCENLAKQKRLRIWKDFVSKKESTAINNFEAPVLRIVGPDLIALEYQNKERIVQLSSLRGPKRTKNEAGVDVGYYLDAIEFLRSRLVGESVFCKIDYVKPAEAGFEARECATILKGEQNMAESLVSRGLANVIRHKRDDNNRSSAYDRLLAAEEKAKEQSKGMFSSKEPPIHRIVDVSESYSKAKSHMTFFQRAGAQSGIVEYVSSGHRFRIFIPAQNCRLTFVLGGIKCPKAPRNDQDKGEPFGAEAARYSSKLVLQRQVEIEIINQDKAGGFIGTLKIHNSDLATLLVESGLAQISAFGGRNLKLEEAEKRAKEQRKNIWSNYEDEVEQVTEKVEQTSVKQLRECLASDIQKDGQVSLQFIDGDKKKQLEKMMREFAQYHATAGQRIVAPFAPKAGEYCSAQFTADKEWYRARVNSASGQNSYDVTYIDYGNQETLTGSRLRPLPSEFNIMNFPAMSTQCKLAYIHLADDPEFYQPEALTMLSELLENQLLVADVVSKTMEVVLYNQNQQGRIKSVNEKLVSLGYANIDPQLVKKYKQEQIRKLKLGQFQEPVKKTELDYLMEAQHEAQSLHLNIWSYGDFTADE